MSVTPSSSFARPVCAADSAAPHAAAAASSSVASANALKTNGYRLWHVLLVDVAAFFWTLCKLAWADVKKQGKAQAGIAAGKAKKPAQIADELWTEAQSTTVRKQCCVFGF